MTTMGDSAARMVDEPIPESGEERSAPGGAWWVEVLTGSTLIGLELSAAGWGDGGEMGLTPTDYFE